MKRKEKVGRALAGDVTRTSEELRVGELPLLWLSWGWMMITLRAAV